MDQTFIYFYRKSRDMTSLKRNFHEAIWFNFHKIFREDVKLLYHKVLKVLCRYMDRLRAMANIRKGGVGHLPSRGAGLRSRIETDDCIC